MNGVHTMFGATAAVIGFAALVRPCVAPAQMGLPVEATVEVTGLSMTLSAADPLGSWILNASGNGNNLVGAGEFIPDETGPASVLYSPGSYPIPSGTPFAIPGLPDWSVDTADGFDGSYRFNRTFFDISAALPDFESFMAVTAAPVPITGPGHYLEPFTYSAYFNLCTSHFAEPCNEYVNAVGSGTLDVALVPYPNLPGYLEVQSISYTSGRITETVPEPGTLVLLAGGIGLGFRRRVRRPEHVGART